MSNQPASILLRNARIVLADRTVEGANLLIDNDRISGVSDSAEVAPSTASSIDLGGLTLWPGFIDVHIHGAVGVDTMEATAESLHQLAAFLASKGTTSWLPTLVPGHITQYESATKAIAELIIDERSDLRPTAARALGVHYEGPFVNDQQCGALHREHFRTFTGPDELNSLPTINDHEAVHMTTVAPEIDGGIQLIDELNKRGWIVSIGHTRANRDQLDQAFASGARHMTHFMNAMSPLHHRSPGPVDWGLINDDVTCDLIADGIHLAPAILKLILRNKTPERVSLISDAIAATGRGDGDFEIWGETITVENGRTQNAQGSIAGSVITMLDAVRLMLSLGFTEAQVAQMSSTNPARLLRRDGECGSIEAGKRADLVALDDQGEVRLTIIGGQVAFQDLS
jgi:N-acetylglucosamine-6-phosphate deacetylase